jgi:hypothetical protein
MFPLSYGLYYLYIAFRRNSRTSSSQTPPLVEEVPTGPETKNDCWGSPAKIFRTDRSLFKGLIKNYPMKTYGELAV